MDYGYMLISLLAIISILITLGAQLYIKSSYSQYTKIKSQKGLTGYETARMILDKNDLKNIKVEKVSGYLSDHYDPSNKCVRLSESNYDGVGIANVSVAAHECGHAIQDKEDYSFMRLRASLVPIVNLSSKAGYIAILLGCLLGALGLVWIGILCEVVILLFQIVTLPVEFDASRRALNKIKEYKILDSKELNGGKTMLTAAALTYVASVASTIIEIFRLILIYGRRNDRD